MRRTSQWKYDFDDYGSGLGALRSPVEALTRSPDATAMPKLIGGEYVSQFAALNAGPKLTDLWASNAGPAWHELHAGPKLSDLWTKNAGLAWHELHAGPSVVDMAAAAVARAREALDIGGRPAFMSTYDLYASRSGAAEMVAEAAAARMELVSARAREAMDVARPGLMMHDVFTKDAGSVWGDLQLRMSDMAKPFSPRRARRCRGCVAWALSEVLAAEQGHRGGKG